MSDLETVNQELSATFGPQNEDLPYMWDVDVDLVLEDESDEEDAPTKVMKREDLSELRTLSSMLRHPIVAIIQPAYKFIVRETIGLKFYGRAA